MPWGSMWMVMPWRWLSRKSSSRRNLVAHICRQSRQYTDTSSSRDCTRNKQHDADGQQHLVNEYLGVLHPVNRYQEHLVNKYLGALCPVNHDQQHPDSPNTSDGHSLQQWWPYTTAMMAIHYSNDGHSLQQWWPYTTAMMKRFRQSQSLHIQPNTKAKMLVTVNHYTVAKRKWNGKILLS